MNKKATIILLICAGFLFFKYLAQLFPSLIGLDLMHVDKINGLELAIMASSYYYSYTFMQFGAGYILDKYNVKYAAFLAILAIGLAMMLFVHVHVFYIMCVSRVIMGIGASFATILYMKCTAMWVERKFFGIISSLLGTATMLGAAVGGAPVALLFSNVGWQNGLEIIAYISILLAILALIFVSSNNEVVPKQQIKMNFSYLKEVLIKFDNWVLLFYSGITFIPVLILGGLWGTPFLVEKFATSVTHASILLSIMFVGVAIGSPVWALLALALKRQKILMHLANIMSFIVIVTIIYIGLSYFITLILFFILGFTISAFMLSFPICREINSLWVMGFAVAFINTGEGIIGTFLEPFIGWILDRVKTGTSFSLANYHIALSVLPICFILSSLSLFFLNEKKAINKND